MKHPADMSTSTDEEPPSKKMRSEESLMPEAQFLAKYKVCLRHHWSWISNGLEASAVEKFICLQNCKQFHNHEKFKTFIYC
jgi:hypothetical protein